jgi:two-component system, LytTR family, response regulator
MSSVPVLRVFVTDDEAPARRKVIRFLEQEAQVVLVGEAGSGAATVAAVPQAKPDLLLLDIQMAGMDGFDVLAALENLFLPKTVFVTAHDEYALRALEIHAFDYLLKPFDQARFSKVIADVRRQTEREQHGESKIALERLLEQVRAQREPRLLVEENGRGTLLSLNHVDWVEADRNYVKLHTGGHTYHVRGTIESIEERVDSRIFLRLNRSALVRIDFIHELQKWTHGEYLVILQSSQQLMWTRRYLARHSELLRNL